MALEWQRCPVLSSLKVTITSNDHPFGCPVIYTDIYSQCSNNAWYNQVYWPIGMPYLSIITSIDFCCRSFLFHIVKPLMPTLSISSSLWKPRMRRFKCESKFVLTQIELRHVWTPTKLINTDITSNWSTRLLLWREYVSLPVKRFILIS